MSTADPQSPEWAPNRQLSDRQTRGLTVVEGHLHGLRFRGSVDRLIVALARIGWQAAKDPLEDGAPHSDLSLGVIQTWGSPWLDILEPAGGAFLSRRVARALAEASSESVLWFDYDFRSDHLRHFLSETGSAERTPEAVEAEGSACTIESINDSYRRWRMRDWGLSFERLAELDLPFSPPLIVEAYFLGLVATSQTPN